MGGDGGGAFFCGAEESGFSQADECPAEFWLEDDDECECKTSEDAVVEVGEACEGVVSEDSDDDGSDDEDEDEAFDGAGGAGALEEAEDGVDHDPDDRQFNQNLPHGVGTEAVEQVLDSGDQSHGHTLWSLVLIDWRCTNHWVGG